MTRLETALSEDQSFIRPKEQEIYESTQWRTSNTGKTRRVNLNDKYEMVYRLVDTTKILDKNSCRVKKGSQRQCLYGGREGTMGNPYLMIDPDPHSASEESAEATICSFSNLPSIQAARKTQFRLNLAYDCEFENSPDSELRLITSYQFAVYLPDEKTILEVVFKSLITDVHNRLYLKTCIGAILSLLVELGALKTTSNSYAEVYTAKTADPYTLVVIDNNAYRSADYKTITRGGVPLDITLICHSGIVDLPAFKDDIFGFRKKKGNIIPYLNSMQGGLTSTFPCFIQVPEANDYWKHYPVNIMFRDTMCYAPSDGKSLANIGDSIGVPKMVLPIGAINNMGRYMSEFPEDYLAYASQDALITLMFGSRLWGVNKEWPLTTTSGACYAMKESIADYLDIPRDKKGNVDKKEFNRVFRGYKEVDKGKIPSLVGLKQMKNLEPLSYEAGQLHDFAAASYSGGINACSFPGVFLDQYTYDYDLKNAYPTAMCLVLDIDFENPIEREFKDEDLSLQAFHTPVDPLFALVDFEFPPMVKFPCIAIHENGSVVFPSKAKEVYASGPSLFLALKLGAHVHIRRGYMARIKMTDQLTPSMSLRAACKQMVHDRAVAKEKYGQGSIEELLCKLFVNGSYGKISQDVIHKNTWDGWSEHMVDIGYSAITSPERAAMITDIVRCMLIGVMNQIEAYGKHAFSVTTDGFITDCCLDEISSCDCFGFGKLFGQARTWLTDGNSTIWTVKHEQGTLINPTTRCNVGFDIPEGCKGVLAHGGIKTIHSEYDYNRDNESIKNYVNQIPENDDFGGEYYKDSSEDRHRMAELILKRSHRILYVSKEFPNVKDLGSSGSMKDFKTLYKAHQIRLDFDMKRKPIRNSINDVSGEIDGISFTYANFETEPYETLEEYRKYREVYETFTCLRTKADWETFFLKLGDKEVGYKRQAPDEWSKLFSVIQGYRFGKWSLPELEACRNVDGSMNVKEALEVINGHNNSNREFNQDAWKNARRQERLSHMLPEEMIKDLLVEFNYIKLSV